MFDFSQLRCFAAVAEELHFGRAAARLNMTQPPLSRQIQVLERILDVQLLERTSRSVRLTAAGRSFLPEAQRILRLAETATHVTRQVAAGRAGVLKLGFTAASAYDFLPRLVTALRQTLPDVTLSLREMVSKDQVEELLAGRIDAALVRPPVTHPDLIAVRALAEPLVVALPAGNPLALRDRLTPGDLGLEPLIATRRTRRATSTTSSSACSPRPASRRGSCSSSPRSTRSWPSSARPWGSPSCRRRPNACASRTSCSGPSRCPRRGRSSWCWPGGARRTSP